MYANILNQLASTTTQNTSPASNTNRSFSKYTTSSKINKKSLNYNGTSADLYNLNAIIDKPNIDLLKATFEFKLNDKSIFNELELLNWLSDDL